MNARQLVVELPYIVSAPEGVRRVRELILQMAITGDLSTSIADDIPAADLIAQNYAKRNSLT